VKGTYILDDKVIEVYASDAKTDTVRFIEYKLANPSDKVYKLWSYSLLTKELKDKKCLK
jgi:hypothetical protein